jgi:hypothetical protein
MVFGEKSAGEVGRGSIKYFDTCVKRDAINTCGEIVALQPACKAQHDIFFVES